MNHSAKLPGMGFLHFSCISLFPVYTGANKIFKTMRFIYNYRQFLIAQPIIKMNRTDVYITCLIIFNIDLDECQNSLHDCDQKCINMVGTYRCQCHLGYKLQADKKTCEGNILQ